MRVLHVLRDVHPFGGKQRYVKETVSLWRSHGHEAALLSFDETVLTWDTPARVLPRLHVNASGASRRVTAALKRLYNTDATQLHGWLLGERFDVAHLHDHTHFSVALLTTLARADIPMVYTLHDYQLICPASVLFRERERVRCEACRNGHFWNAVRYRCSHGRFTNSLISSLDTWLHVSADIERRVQRFIAPSRSVIETFRSFGWSKAKLVHLPHFVSVTEQVSAPIQRRRTSRVLCVARLWNQKGVDVLLRAVARLRTKQVEVIIVGDGPRRLELQALADELGLQGVQFLGHLEPTSTAQAYAEALCAVVPSVWLEVFGLVVLEAFAARCPVIASRTGGLAEIVDNGVDGWLVPPGDVDALAERLDWMFSHPAQAAEMGEAGYHKVSTRYTPARHYQGLLEIYNQVIEEHRQSRP